MLKALVVAAAAPIWVIEAVGAPFEAKDLLRARGCRWNAEARLWSPEVPLAGFDHEIEWATLELYGSLREPAFRQVTWSDRHRAFVPAGVDQHRINGGRHG